MFRFLFELYDRIFFGIHLFSIRCTWYFRYDQDFIILAVIKDVQLFTHFNTSGLVFPCVAFHTLKQLISAVSVFTSRFFVVFIIMYR
jgi:hypothetical protein